MTGHRKPTAFDLADEEVAVVRAGEHVPAAARVVVEETGDAVEEAPLVVVPTRRGVRWGRMFWSGLAGLISLGVGIYLDGLVRDLFARDDWLGWTALGLLALTGVAALAIVLKEIAGLIWLKRIDRLRLKADTAIRLDDRRAADGVVDEVMRLYADRPDLAHARTANAAHRDEIIDGRDRLVLLEADVLAGLDVTATRLVADAARRVSVVTAISPRAAVDVLFVAIATLALIRRIANLYGGRPGLLGFLRLTRHVISHLAVTGSIAVGDSLVQQLIGHGLAAKLSARLGEGVINGLLTARVGIAAIEVCRPLPFIERDRPGVSEVMQGVMGKGG
ncbi:YcjF family protein [Oryzibacter oryziterrae]|uniref:YcjF family protein n=1 Tax=Oryzibacter oryziterrae TaxID=2766474 RepID=UPI001F41E432|nr:TIGR01620 family protein [Oryzibacter oryziterrae]